MKPWKAGNAVTLPSLCLTHLLCGFSMQGWGEKKGVKMGQNCDERGHLPWNQKKADKIHINFGQRSYIETWMNRDEATSVCFFSDSYIARASIRRATPFFQCHRTQQQITKAAESNLVTINRVIMCF